MKKLFSYLSNENAPAQSSGGTAANDGGATTPPNKTSILKRLGRGTPKSANNSQPDTIPNLIIAASSTLNDAIQLIISDTSNLAGDNLTGYQNLVDILDDQVFYEDPLDIRSSSGAGCMNVLVQYIDHQKFIELCNQMNLATGLFQTMRLLRMMEIKHAKSVPDSTYNAMIHGITFAASRNVCKILEKLFSHSTTIEQNRQLLVKILTFPLSVLPVKGLHIQIHSAQIITAICKSGFTSQQVWFLHDVQAVSHMVRHLQELVALPSDQSIRDKPEKSNDYLLKGLSAEKEEMWIIAVDCIVDVINAASVTSTVLLNDFETCGGSRLMLQLLRTCSSDRFLRTLNSITNLLSNASKKAEDQMVVAMVSSIISEFLLTTLSLTKPVQQGDSVDSLIDVCTLILENCDGFFIKDYIMQGISYALLTMYSNDPTSCSQLEDSYFFLPLIILVICSLPQTEPISAVLTTANYICQCTDSASGMIHRALCAAASVSIDRALDMSLSQRQRQTASLQNELLFSSIEAISRTNPNNATSFLKCGLLKYVVSEPLEKLCEEISNGIRVDEISSAAFQRIISLIVDLNSKSAYTAEEIRKSGIGVLLRNIVGSPCVSSAFVTTLLKLYEELSTVDALFLQESLITIMTLTKEIKGDWEKQIILFESLWRILLESEGSATMHVKEGGIECSFQCLKYLKGVFLQDKDLHLELQCLEAIVRFLSLLVFLASEEAIDGQFSFNIAKLIVETKIFQSEYHNEGIEILFRFVTVYSQDPDFIYSNSLDVISELFKLLKPETVKAFINRFIEFAVGGPVDRRKVLGDAEIIPKFLRVFNSSQILENDSSVQIMKQLVTILAQSYLTLESSLSIMKFLLRPAIKSSFDNRTTIINRYSALAITESSKLFDSFSHDCLLYAPFSDFPYFAIKVGGNTEESTMSGSLAMFFTGETTISLPSPALTFSCWFRLSEERRDDNVVIIPLVSLESANNACSITLELNIDSNEVIITSAKMGSVVEEPLRLKSGLSLKTTDWTYLVFSIRKIKRLTGSGQTSINVSFNGIPWLSNNNNGTSCITTDALSGSQDGEIRLGYSKFINSSFAATVSPMTLHIGLIAIYPEILNQRQITLLFFKGPTYLGSDMNASATLDSLATMSTHGLRVSNYVSKHAINYLDKAGMKGIEFMVEPRSESHRDLVLGFEPPFMVQPIVLISAAVAYRERLSFNIVKTQADNGEFKYYTKVRPTRHSMVNLVDFDMERLVATLASTGGVTRAMSFSNCIAAVGGPDLLLPLVYSAQDSESLLAALKMLLLVTRQNSQNLSQVQSLSYRAIAYILHQLPTEYITRDVFALLLQFMNDNSAGSLRIGLDSLMLVDASAAVHLLFNDHVWRSSNFSLVLEFLRNIKSLVLDEKYSYINCVRLSCIGASRWILLLSLHVIENLNDLGLTQVNGQLLWKYIPRSAYEVADFRDDPEEFLQLSMLAVQSISGTELRVRDLELISGMILYTFQKSTEWAEHLTNVAGIQTKWKGTEVMEAYPFCTFEYDESVDKEVPSRLLGPLELLRIYLLRLLMAMFDDYSDEARRQGRRNSAKTSSTANQESDPFNLFRAKCSPVWFLTILERCDDLATKSQTLRLLGMLLQKDEVFTREFSELRGFQILYTMLASKPQEIPVVIPVIALLFRIPVQLLLHPSQLKNINTFAQLLDLGDFGKELLQEPVLIEQTLPLLNIYHECMMNAERCEVSLYPWAPRVAQLMMGVLEYAFDHLPLFRQLMQNKLALEIHINSFLSCTNAFVDFGSKIFESSNTIDLTSAIRDNYIRLSGGIAQMFSDEHELIRELNENMYMGSDSSGTRLSLEITHSLGNRLRKLCIAIQQSGLKEHDNAKVLGNFFMSFSTNIFGESYECDYQLLVLQIFKESVAELLTTSVDVKLFASIGRTIANMVPLVKALFVYDTACFELLRMVIELFRRCTMVLQPRLSSASSDQFELNTIRDLGYSIRFFMFILLNAVSYQSGKTNHLGKLPILTLLRENMDLFFNNYLEDSSEVLSSTIGLRFIPPRSSTDDKSLQSNQVFEALQGFASPTGSSQRKSSSLQASITQIRSERNKVAQVFAFFLISYAYSLVLEDEALVRIEATRVIAYIVNYRRSLVEPILSSTYNQNKSLRKLTSDENDSQGVDIFRDGLMKLVPNDEGHYQLYICGGTDDNNSEDNRFADFSFWISNNNGRCDKVFRGIDSSLHSILPNITQEVEDFNRSYVTQLRARDLWIHDQADSVRASMERAEQGQRLGEKVSRLLVQWKNDGIRDLTIGAIHWRKVWTLLRSSPIWGYQIMQDDLQSNRSKIIWRVEYREGPEKARKKLLQDLSPFNPTLFGESKVPSTAGRIGSAAISSYETILATGSDHEIEQLLRQMNKQGILRKQIPQMEALDNIDGQEMADEISAAFNKAEVLDTELLDESMIESAPITPLESSASDSRRHPALSIDLSNENEEEFDKLNATAESMDLELLDAPEQQMIISAKDKDRIDRCNTSSAREKRKLSRSIILKEIIRGIINNNTELKSSRIYNVERISGLETQKAVLFLSDQSIYILCGITAMDQSKKIVDQIFHWVPTPQTKSSSQSSSNSELSDDLLSEEEWVKCVWKDLIESETAFFHIPIEDIYSFFKRRYQLKHTAMEITDSKGHSVLFSCSSVSDCDVILTTLLERDLPSSIFNKMMGLKNLQLLRGATNMYNRLIIYFLSSLTLLWQHGEITNFEYLMHINSAAGRSFHDLTQYPVFPWVISDYSSKDLDLNNKSMYRDLSKPMGALGQKRSQQYLERYQTMDDFYKEGIEGSSPPFFYGTHYSCAGYVLHYLLRLQPYANMSLALQGGNFDKADRLFYNLGNSWLSASQENLQDVRELIPEFYYLPDFLSNANKFDLGITQRDEVIGDVVLPPWANNDPKEFIRIHRQALESKYVSENLHQWIDLIFGYKQRGKASIDAMNVFLHITYEGEVDLDAIEDPVLKSATLSQINNFGQTPSKLFHKSHPKKYVPDVVRKLNDMILVEPVALSWHAHLSPPLSVAGAPKFNFLNRISFTPVRICNSH